MDKKYIVFTLIISLMIVSTVKISYSTDKEELINTKMNFFKPVISKLIKKGIDSTFIYKLIEDERTQFDEKFVKINVTGFLKKADYSSNYNELSINKSKSFINDYNAILSLAEVKYGVPKEVITAILWIETKHGTYLGNNHIVSVYLSTAMCDHPEFVEINKKELRKDFTGSANELKEYEKKIDERSTKKAKWALEQLIALEKLDKISPLPIMDLKGSWAGAFGWSQFLPSSYVSWAVDGNSDGIINLFDAEDAIFSVANYLKINGWGEDKEKQRKAVFHYNNSTAYVDAVLTLTEKIKPIPVFDTLQTIDATLPLNEQIKH